MATDLSTWIQAGRLAADPELRTTTNDKAVCNFAIGSDVGHGDRKQTNWWKVTCWGATAELAHRILSKGAYVTVEGYPVQNKWVDSEGRKQFSIHINCNRFHVHQWPKSIGEDQFNRSEVVSEEEVPF